MPMDFEKPILNCSEIGLLTERCSRMDSKTPRVIMTLTDFGYDFHSPILTLKQRQTDFDWH